jgi:broad specificity phosphatase PhoE
MQNFYLIRHGETDWNVKLKKLQGHTDIPLNEKGLEQGQTLAHLIGPLRITKVVSSDLVRAHKTASFLSSQIEIAPELREVHLGVGEGLTWDEVEALLGPEFRQRWSENHTGNIDMRFPNGESRREVLERIEKCLRHFLQKNPQDVMAFVSHGYAIRSLVYHLSSIRENFFVPNCAVVPFSFDGERIRYTGPETTDLLLQPR